MSAALNAHPVGLIHPCRVHINIHAQVHRVAQLEKVRHLISIFEFWIFTAQGHIDNLKKENFDIMVTSLDKIGL